MKKLLILGICLLLAISSTVIACQREETYPEVIVSVKLVADEEYRQERNSWEEEAGRQLEATSEFYQKQFGIRFLADEFIEWESPDLTPAPEGVYELAGTQWLADNAADEIPNQGKLVVILTGEDLSRRNAGILLTTERRGFKEYYVLVWAGSINPQNGLIHEIAHFFGAKHPQEWSWEYAEKYPSVMDPVKVFSTNTFDPKNRQIVLKNRDKFQEEVQNQINKD